jgi:D-alanyl-D-alanine carboxypeptidase/D-alanyl-D-alanine-endopeptidase (penicillin-binding protein 4)
MQLFGCCALILSLNFVFVASGPQCADGQSVLLCPATIPLHQAWPGGPDTALGQQIATLLGDPAVSRAHWGVAVTTLDGTPIYGLDEGKLFRPASNNKIFTTATAMALLGPDATVTTTVTTTGAIDANGTLHGDLILHGAGDANLSGQTFPYVSPQARKVLAAESDAAPNPPPDPLTALDDLAGQVAAHGVKRIEGSVIGDDQLWPWEPYGNSWAVDDLVWGYGAPVSALVVNDNTVQLTIQGGQHAGDRATLMASPSIGWTSFNNDVTTVAAASPAHIDIDTLTTGDTASLRLTGTIAAGKTDTEDIAVTSPTSFAAKAFASRLAALNIVIIKGAEAEEILSTAQILSSQTPKNGSGTSSGFETGNSNGTAGFQSQHGPVNAPVCDHCTLLASRVSPTLAQDATLTLKVSQNLHAEMMLRRLGAAFGTQGSFEEGVRVVRNYLIQTGLDPGDFVFFDGSGLSPHDLVTPRATAQFLAFTAKQPWFPAWKASLPKAGEDGSLDRRFPDPPLKDHLFAKTGTLGESRALSGYLDAASGRPIIFSVFVDDHTPVSTADRITMDKIVAAIAANN